MQQDFETLMKEFIAKVQTHFDAQNSTLAEYEQFFTRAQELFPAYENFIQQVNDQLEAINQEQQRLESEPVEVPVAAVSVSPKPRKILSEKKKILIVDDAEINRILMGHFFKNSAAQLEFASSGEQSLEKSQQQAFDLVLMDLQMKGMSGVEAIRAIRSANPEHQMKTTIIGITNQEPTESEKSDVLQAGANEYLSKSMPRDILKEKIFNYLISASSLSA